MKFFLKIVPFFFVAFFLIACDDESPLNTAYAIVGMEKAEYNVKENKGLFTIPLVATGERNGDINVTVAVATTSGNCIEDEHFMVTAKTLTIPASTDCVNVEIKTIDDRVINEDRSFVISIVSAQGATIDTQANQTMVTLLDNDNIPYDRMGGIWVVTAMNALDESGMSKPVSWRTTLSTIVDDEEEGYGKDIVMSPWMMWNNATYEDVLDIVHTLSFHYNESTQSATIDLRLGEVMASGFVLGGENEDGFNLTDCKLRSATPTAMSYTTMGTVIGTVSDNFTKITFNLPLLGILYDANETPFSYWFWYTDIVMTKE